MGKADIAVKNWLSDRERFADLFNGTVFGGRQVVLPEELEDMDRETDIIITDKGEKEQIDMCKALDDIYADGVRDEKIFIITRMIKEGMSASVIRKCTEATDQEIEQARNEMKSK